MVKPSDVTYPDTVERPRACALSFLALESLLLFCKQLRRFARRAATPTREVRTRRLVIVDEAGRSMIVATADDRGARFELRSGDATGPAAVITGRSDGTAARVAIELRDADDRYATLELSRVPGEETGSAQLEIRCPTGHAASLKAHVVRVQHREGTSAHLLATPDDTELYLRAGSSRRDDGPESARVALHAMRGWPGSAVAVGRASVELATGKNTRRFEADS